MKTHNHQSWELCNAECAAQFGRHADTEARGHDHHWNNEDRCFKCNAKRPPCVDPYCWCHRKVEVR